jgi:hypothetical protein
MRIYAAALLFFISLLSSPSFGQGTVATFMKQSLQIDLDSIHFGAELPKNGEYGEVSPPMSAAMRWGVMSEIHFNLFWMTNAYSAKYQQKFKNRNLIYAFRDGKLIAIQIMLSVVSFSKDQREIQKRELQEIHEELIKASPFHVAGMDDGTFKLAGSEGRFDSGLSWIELEITPSERSKQSRPPITSP